MSSVTVRRWNWVRAIVSSQGQGISSDGSHAAALSTKRSTSSKVPSWEDNTTDNKPSS